MCSMDDEWIDVIYETVCLVVVVMTTMRPSVNERYARGLREKGLQDIYYSKQRLGVVTDPALPNCVIAYRAGRSLEG